MEEKFFSIIIPVYNIKKYIQECVESVLCQSYKNYEVLLIDDGSTDGSGVECDKYAEESPKVKVIHKRNGGISSARNMGIEKSNGKYIIFLDGDDYWIDRSALDKIHEAVMETYAEIIVFHGFEINELSRRKTRISNNYVEEMQEKIYDGKEYLKTVLTGKENFYWYAWLYAIQKSYWHENGFLFNEKTRAFEDVELMYSVLLECSQIKVIDFPLYHYRTNRNGSLTTAHNIKLIQDISKVADKILMQTDKFNEKELQEIVQNHFSHNYYLCCILINDLEKEEYIEAMRELKEKRRMMEYTYKGRDRLLRLIISIFGVDIAVKLLGLRKRIREKRAYGRIYRI